MKIIICGLTAAGKTTHSQLLARDLNYSYINGSSILSKLINSPTKRTPDFWITDESFALDKLRLNNPSIDLQLDDYLKQTLEGPQDNIIFDVWTLPWLSQYKALRIWLESSLESRVIKSMRSYMGVSSFSYKDVLKRLPIRDQHTREFYLKHYKFDIFSDRLPFDFVIDISCFVSELNADPCKNIQNVHEILLALVTWYQRPETLHPEITRIFDSELRSIFLKTPEQLQALLKNDKIVYNG